MVRWNLDAEEVGKAYADDEFTNEDWQLLDFMKKLGLPYPLDDDGNPKGQVYKLWTKELRLKSKTNISSLKQIERDVQIITKPWWKFW